jgi:hypothetical protein
MNTAEYEFSQAIKSKKLAASNLDRLFPVKYEQFADAAWMQEALAVVLQKIKTPVLRVLFKPKGRQGKQISFDKDQNLLDVSEDLTVSTIGAKERNSAYLEIEYLSKATELITLDSLTDSYETSPISVWVWHEDLYVSVMMTLVLR